MKLILLSVIAVAAFWATRAIAADDERLQRLQAAAWFEAAEAGLRAGHNDEALQAFRRAAVRDRKNDMYRLALARGLVRSGRDEEARRLLLTLRQARPEDPDANLELARLEGRAGDRGNARRLYENALAALWAPEHAPRRRLLRLELIDFLLAHDERARALAELLVLAANLPDQAEVHADVGRRFLVAGEPRRALDQFVQATSADPGNREALVGAGESAFELGDYADARRYFDAVSGRDRRIEELREVARLVLASDPLALRVRLTERRRRLVTAFEQATGRLDGCLSGATSGPREELEMLHDDARAFATIMGRRVVARDVIDDGVDLVYRIERAVERSCRTPAAPLDRALLLIGRRHALENA